MGVNDTFEGVFRQVNVGVDHPVGA